MGDKRCHTAGDRAAIVLPMVRPSWSVASNYVFVRPIGPASKRSDGHSKWLGGLTNQTKQGVTSNKLFRGSSTLQF